MHMYVCIYIYIHIHIYIYIHLQIRMYTCTGQNPLPSGTSTAFSTRHNEPGSAGRRCQPPPPRPSRQTSTGEISGSYGHPGCTYGTRWGPLGNKRGSHGHRTMSFPSRNGDFPYIYIYMFNYQRPRGSKGICWLKPPCLLDELPVLRRIFLQPQRSTLMLSFCCATSGIAT